MKKADNLTVEGVFHYPVVSRQVHILNEGLILPFVKTWLEMIFSFLITPISYAVVLIVRPLTILFVYLVNFAAIMWLSRGCKKSIKKLTGHELFWLAPSIDKSARHRLNFASVAVITLKDTLALTEVKELILQRVVEAVDPNSNKKIHPRFSQRVAALACGKAWVEDDEFHIDNHVVECTEEIKNSKRLMELVGESSMLPFHDNRPRWRINFVPSYPYKMSTVIFSCDPCMADGVYLLNLLHTSLADEPPKEYTRRHFGAFNQGFDYFRSIFSGIVWFFKNLSVFQDGMSDFWPSSYEVTPRKQSRNSRMSSRHLSKPSRSSVETPNESLFTPFPEVEPSLKPRRKFLVFGPLPLSKITKTIDVTKATADEVILAALSSSLRDYMYHIYGTSNPSDMAAIAYVALQASPMIKTGAPTRRETEADETENINDSSRAGKRRRSRRSADKKVPADLFACTPEATADVSTAEEGGEEGGGRHSNRSRRVDPGRGDSCASNPSPSCLAKLPSSSPPPPPSSSSSPPPPPPPPPPPTQNQTEDRPPEELKVAYAKPRSYSVGVVPQLHPAPRLFHSQVDANRSDNNPEKLYARNVEVPTRMVVEDFDESYVRAKSSKLTREPRLSFMRFYLPTSVEGILPSLWHVKNRILELKTSTDHVSFYRACNFLNTFLPSRANKWLLNRIQGRPTVVYHSLIGSKSRISVGGTTVRNIFFWGPVFHEECISISCMTYLNSITMTFNVNEDLQRPELIYQFFAKKFDDLNDMLQYRRVRQQPRTDTILVPFGRFSSYQKDILDDDVGEYVQLRRNRSGRLRTSFSAMRRSSMAVITSLVGISRSNSGITQTDVSRRK